MIKTTDRPKTKEQIRIERKIEQLELYVLHDQMKKISLQFKSNVEKNNVRISKRMNETIDTLDSALHNIDFKYESVSSLLPTKYRYDV